MSDGITRVYRWEDLCALCIQVVMVLKKEVMNSGNGGSNADSSDMASYRQCLVRTLHSCSIKFNSVAPAVVPLVSVTYHFCLLQ